MIKLIFVLSVFLSGCGHIWMRGYFPDPEFRKYVQEYKNAKKYYTGSGSTDKYITVKFSSKVPDTKVGSCVMYETGNARKIIIKRKTWYKLNETGRFIFILHEMGHCDLDLSHCNCIGIMQENQLSDYLFDTNRKYYLKQLFLKGR